MFDLDNDGQTEILAGFSIFDALGNKLHSFDEPTKISLNKWMNAIYPVDLNNDGETELLVGNAAYSSTGEKLWQAAFSDGHASQVAYWAFANFDNDDALEMVLVERADDDAELVTLSLLDDDGSFIWHSKAIEYIGQPILGDFDLDGLPDIFVSGEDALFDHTGKELWRLSGHTRKDGNEATAADIQGNGRSEIVMFRGNTAKVIDSLTGAQIIVPLCWKI